VAEAPARPGPAAVTAANTSQTVVVAGAAGTWEIIRDITIVNETDGLVTVTYGIGTTNTDAVGKRLLRKYGLSPGGLPFSWGGFLPLMGGSSPDLLYIICDTANGATVTLGAVTGP
jgi:hypothetical protein